MLRATERLLEQPWVYRAWQAPFADRKFAPILASGDIGRARRVLDIGCGPGTNAARFAHADYLGVDLNPAYVASAARRYRGRFLAADVNEFAESAGERFDFILSNSLLHHLDDAEVARLMRSVTRLLTEDGHVHVLDLVLPPQPSAARLLARWDRGRFARSLAAWESLLAADLELVTLEPYDLGLPGLPLWRMVYFKGRRRR